MEHLIISITQLPFELFTQKAFTVLCILRSVNRTIKITVLIDTDATGYAFVNFSFAHILCEILQIEPSPLVKSKTIKAFNEKPTEWITHDVYSCLKVAGHCESTAPLMITNLRNHQMILSLLWLEAHDVIVDFAARRLLFKPHHCTHAGALLDSVKIPLKSWEQLWTSPPSLKPVVASVKMTILKWSEPQKVTGTWLSMNHKKKPRPTSVTKTLPLKKDFVDIKMIETASIMS